MTITVVAVVRVDRTGGRVAKNCPGRQLGQLPNNVAIPIQLLEAAEKLLCVLDFFQSYLLGV
jgi:hypothetical protein